MILFRPGSILTKPVSMRSEYKESSKDVQSSFVAHTYWQHCVKTNLELLSLSHVDPWAKPIKQGITGKSKQNVLPVTQTRKGIAYATSSGQVTVMAKCSRPSQYDHVGVEAVEVSEKLLTNFDSDTAVFLKSLGLIHPFVLFFDPLNVFSLPCSFRTLCNTCAIFLKSFLFAMGPAKRFGSPLSKTKWCKKEISATMARCAKCQPCWGSPSMCTRFHPILLLPQNSCAFHRSAICPGSRNNDVSLHLW